MTISSDGEQIVKDLPGNTKITQIKKGARKAGSTTMVGIDLGVARFATLSDGTVFPALCSLKRLEGKLRRAQRSLSRKVKFSNNWRNQKVQLSRLSQRVVDARTDHLHKGSTAISKSHAMVVLEDLRVQNMSASVKGTVDNPGRNGKAKAGLNRAILGQGWYAFRRMLTYKQAWRGGGVVLVDAQNTSRTCSACSYIHAANRTAQAVVACVLWAIRSTPI